MTFRVTEVIASFTADGWPVPAQVRWKGAYLDVINVGRRWRESDGIHVLVLVSGGIVFELHTNGSLWRARIVSEPPHFA